MAANLISASAAWPALVASTYLFLQRLSAGDALLVARGRALVGAGGTAAFKYNRDGQQFSAHQ